MSVRASRFRRVQLEKFLEASSAQACSNCVALAVQGYPTLYIPTVCIYQSKLFNRKFCLHVEIFFFEIILISSQIRSSNLIL